MSYNGRQPTVGTYEKLDSIASSFNGSTTAFNLTIGGVAIDNISSLYQFIISVNGVIQEPGVTFTVSTTQIIFTTAPAAGSTFFGIKFGDVLSFPTVGDGAVTSSKIAAGAVGTSQIATGAITSSLVAASAIGTTNLAAGAVTTSIIADGSITTSKYVANSITATAIASGTITTTQIAANTITTGNLNKFEATPVTVSSGTQTFNIANGDWQKATIAGNCTFAFTFTSGQCQVMTLELVNAGLYTITWPTINWPRGYTPLFKSSGTDIVYVRCDANGVLYAEVPQPSLKGALGFASYFQSSQIVISDASQHYVAHGLGTVPILYRAELVCITAQGGYAVGDVVDVSHTGGEDQLANAWTCNVWVNSTYIGWSNGSSGCLVQNKAGGGGGTGISTADWKLVLKAWA